MNFVKYDKNKGGNGTTIVNNYAGAGSVSVDLTDIYNKINSLQASLLNASNEIAGLRNTINGLDSVYLNHGGDEDSGAYSLGRVISDDVISPWYFSHGMGYRLVYSESGYCFDIKDVAIGSIGLTTTNATSSSLNHNEETFLDVQLDNAFTITNNIQGAYVLFKAGVRSLPSNATLVEEHAYVSISQQLDPNATPVQQAPAIDVEEDNGEVKRVIYNDTTSATTMYSEDAYEVAKITLTPIGDLDTGTTIHGRWSEITKDGNEWFIPLKYDGRQTTYSIYYTATVFYNGQTEIYCSAYIEGTDATNNLTRYYGGTSKHTHITPDSVTIEEGNNATKITPTAIQRTTNGGTTWQTII